MSLFIAINLKTNSDERFRIFTGDVYLNGGVVFSTDTVHISGDAWSVMSQALMSRAQADAFSAYVATGRAGCGAWTIVDVSYSREHPEPRIDAAIRMTRAGLVSLTRRVSAPGGEHILELVGSMVGTGDKPSAKTVRGKDLVAILHLLESENIPSMVFSQG